MPENSELNTDQKLWVKDLFTQLIKDKEIRALYGIVLGSSDEQLRLSFSKLKASLNETVIRNCPISLDKFGDDIKVERTALVLVVDKEKTAHFIAYDDASLKKWTKKKNTNPATGLEILQVFAGGKLSTLQEYKSRPAVLSDLSVAMPQRPRADDLTTGDREMLARFDAAATRILERRMADIRIHTPRQAGHTPRPTSRNQMQNQARPLGDLFDGSEMPERTNAEAGGRRLGGIVELIGRNEDAVRTHVERIRGAGATPHWR